MLHADEPRAQWNWRCFVRDCTSHPTHSIWFGSDSAFDMATRQKYIFRKKGRRSGMRARGVVAEEICGKWNTIELINFISLVRSIAHGRQLFISCFMRYLFIVRNVLLWLRIEIMFFVISPEPIQLKCTPRGTSKPPQCVKRLTDHMREFLLPKIKISFDWISIVASYVSLNKRNYLCSINIAQP